MPTACGSISSWRSSLVKGCLAASLWFSPLALSQGLPEPLHAQGEDEPASTLERFLRVRVPTAPQMTPDGRLYVRDWPDGIFQLYRAEGISAGPGKAAKKLTSYADGLGGYSLSPDGSKIVLFHATGGNENTQISLLNEATGEVIPLCSNPAVQHALNLWLPDSSGFIYSANAESPNDFYLYQYDLATKTSKRILAKPGSWEASAISPDFNQVLVGQYRSISDSEIFELIVSTQQLTSLNPKTPQKTLSANWVGYLPDNQNALFVSDLEDGKLRVYLMDLAEQGISRVLSSVDDFEIETAQLNELRSLLAVVTNENGFGKLHVFRVPSFEEVQLPPIEDGVVTLSSLSGNRIIWTLNNARSPGISFTAVIPDEPGATIAATQITSAEEQGLDLAAFPLPELIRYTAFDGLKIPAFLWLPKGYTKGTPIPFVVNYHGGPEGQSRPQFSAPIQYLLSEGFGVIQPNVRGSTGYGRAFHMMDDYKKRWDSVRDGVDAAEWLVAEGYAIEGKIATYGGSYGGFMSVACLVEDQQRVDAKLRENRLFGAGINVVGIVNLQTFLEKTSGYRRKLREVEYGPLSDPEFLKSVSSIHKIDKLNVPMFIAHGFNDPRVPIEEAMQLATSLKDQAMARKDMKLMPQLFVAPDEGHGFAKLENRRYFTQRMVQFLKETIGE